MQPQHSDIFLRSLFALYVYSYAALLVLAILAKIWTGCSLYQSAASHKSVLWKISQLSYHTWWYSGSFFKIANDRESPLPVLDPD